MVTQDEDRRGVGCHIAGLCSAPSKIPVDPNAPSILPRFGHRRGGTGVCETAGTHVDAPPRPIYEYPATVGQVSVYPGAMTQTG